MGKSIYRVTYQHILLSGKNTYDIDLDNTVIGVHLRVFPSSPVGLMYGLNENPSIPLSPTDLPASYGGYHVNGMPAVISENGQLQVQWGGGSTAGQGVAIISRLVLQPTTQQVCD